MPGKRSGLSDRRKHICGRKPRYFPAGQNAKPVQQLPVRAAYVVEAVVFWVDLVVPATFNVILRLDEMPAKLAAYPSICLNPRFLQFPTNQLSESSVLWCTDRIQLWIDPCSF